MFHLKRFFNFEDTFNGDESNFTQLYVLFLGETQKVIHVEIIDNSPRKPFLGGFRHKVTGTEYLNASCQTFPKKY